MPMAVPDEQKQLTLDIEHVNHWVQVTSLQQSIPLPQLLAAKEILQTFDPPGVGAEDLRECLLIQLRDPTRAQPANPLAIEILDQHFDALQRCKYPEIARALKVDQERVIEAVHEIATLEPKPGRRAWWRRYIVLTSW
jgi:RNA polymerase sigma-54 factor